MVREQFSLLEKTVKGVKSFARSSILTLAMGFAAIGCSGPNGSQDTVPMNGIAADGPFQADSEVFINKLDNDLNGTSETTYARTDALGRYSTELGKHSCFLSTVTGKDFNEITGQGSATDISISSFYCTTSSTADKTENDVTQMVLERVKDLYRGKLSFDTASKQARDELFSQFDFIVGTPDCLPYEMNIITGSSTCNDPLLAVEIVVRNYAVDEAEQSGNTIEYELHDMISSIMFDLADDGTLSQDIKDKLNESARGVDVANATANLQQYLDTHGGTAKAPNADNVLDSDLDGIVNAEDCLPHDTLRWTGHADVDADGHEAIACGGDDCDDDCATCYPGAAEMCGEARDHDCDGLIDELNGCGAGDCVVGVPSVVGTLTLQGDVHSVYVSGTNAYIAADNIGFAVIDISDPTTPALISELIVDNIRNLTLSDNKIYPTSAEGMYIIDISSPESPTVLSGPLNVGTNDPKDIAVSVKDSQTYVVSGDGLSVVDVSDAYNPKLLAGPEETDSSNFANGVFVRNSLAYVADSVGFYLMRYSSDESILPVSESIDTGQSNDVYVSNEHAFVGTSSGLYILDVALPETPLILSGPVSDKNFRKVMVSDNQLFGLTPTSISVLDISDVLLPIETAEFTVGTNNHDFFVSGSHAYLVDQDNFYVIDLDCSD